jgi:hypothetical protein
MAETTTSSTTTAETKATAPTSETESQDTTQESTALPAGESPEDESGKETAEGKEQETKEDPEDSKTFDIEGETVTLADLKQGFRYIQKAVSKVKEAKRLHAIAEKTVTGIVEDTSGTLLDIFTGVFKGDRDKAYEYVVKQAIQIVNEHIKFEGLSDAEKKALKKELEANEYKSKLEKYESEKKQTALKEAQKAWEDRIGEAAKKAGLSSDPDTIEDIAKVLLKAKEAGYPLVLDKAVAVVKKEYQKRRSKMWSDANVEEIPAEFLKKLRDKDLEAVKNGTTPAKTPTKAEPEKMTIALPKRQSSR